MDNPKIATLVSVQIRQSKDEHRWFSNFRQKLLKRAPVSEGAKGVLSRQASRESTTILGSTHGLGAKDPPFREHPDRCHFPSG
jgi:hypothetical protein